MLAAITHFPMGFTLASNCSRHLQFFTLSGKSIIPSRNRLRLDHLNDISDRTREFSDYVRFERGSAVTSYHSY